MSATATTTQPQEKKKSLGDVYKDFMAEAVERFPHLKGRLLILDMNEYKAYGHNDIDFQKTGLTPDTVREYLDSHDTAGKMRGDKNKSSCAKYDPQRKLCIIFINDRIDEADIKNISEKNEEHILFVLRHELAHLAIDNGYYTGDDLYTAIIGESIADAYTLICHYQGRGADNEYCDTIMNPSKRSANMVLGDRKHFTAFVLDEIIRHKDLIDFKKLDHAQTIELAWNFAMEYLPPPPVIDRLYKTFAHVRKVWQSSREEGIKALIDITLNPESGYNTFKLGNSWLKKYLEDRTFYDGIPINLPKEYLDDVARRLKIREFKFAQEGILFNVPTVAAKPQAAPANQLRLF